MGRLPKLTVKAAADFELHDAEEWLPGRITDITTTDDTGFGEGLKYILVLDDDDENDDGSDREIWAFSSQKVSRKSKLGGWAKAILVDEYPEEGDTLDLNTLLQVPIEVMFEQFKGQDSDGNEVTKEKVVKMRAKKAKAKAKAKAKPVEPEDDDEEEESQAGSLAAKQKRAQAARKAKADENVEPF